MSWWWATFFGRGGAENRERLQWPRANVDPKALYTRTSI